MHPVSGGKRFGTDVLVVGGGIAGHFAAIKASEQGATVILVDKGYAGKSGQSPYARSLMVFNPDWGHRLDAWMDYINRTSEYVNNRYWTELAITESYGRYQDPVSWGVQFRKGTDGEPLRYPTGPGIVEHIEFEKTLGDYEAIIRKQALKNGVTVLDGVTITELLKQDRRIVGAIGIPLDNYDLYTFIAKTTILCAGGCGFKPMGYQPLVQLTCDGESMAYRAGAEILGKEFVDTHSTRVDYPGIIGRRAIPPGFEGILRAAMVIRQVLRKACNPVVARHLHSATRRGMNCQLAQKVYLSTRAPIFNLSLKRMPVGHRSPSEMLKKWAGHALGCPCGKRMVSGRLTKTVLQASPVFTRLAML